MKLTTHASNMAPPVADCNLCLCRLKRRERQNPPGFLEGAGMDIRLAPLNCCTVDSLAISPPSHPVYSVSVTGHPWGLSRNFSHIHTPQLAMEGVFFPTLHCNSGFWNWLRVAWQHFCHFIAGYTMH